MPQSENGDQRATFRSRSLLRKRFHPRNNLRPIVQAFPCFRDVFSAPCSYSSIFSQKQPEFSTLRYSPKFTLGEKFWDLQNKQNYRGSSPRILHRHSPRTARGSESLEGIPTPASSLGGAPPVGPACANLLQLPLTT